AGQGRQFLLAGEGIKRRDAGGSRLFRAGKRHDFVLLVDGESRHLIAPGTALSAVITVIALGAIKGKAIFTFSSRGRCGKGSTLAGTAWMAETRPQMSKA